MSSSSSSSSPWTILSLPPHSSRELIRAQYKRLALQYHPDKNPGDRAQWATEKMTELSLAYERAMNGSAAGATATATATTTTTTDAPPHPPPSSVFSYATPPLFANRADEKDQGKGKKKTTTATTTAKTTRKRAATTATRKRATTATARKRAMTATRKTTTTKTAKTAKTATKPTLRQRTTTASRKKKTPDQDPAGDGNQDANTRANGEVSPKARELRQRKMHVFYGE